MNTPNPEVLPDDLLFRIERQIARRADELARSSIPSRPLPDYWWQAECEVWENGQLAVTGIERAG